MILIRQRPRRGTFTKWFAWYPVFTPDGLVWRETVWCYRENWSDGPDWHYERINGTRNSSIPSDISR